MKKLKEVAGDGKPPGDKRQAWMATLGTADKSSFPNMEQQVVAQTDRREADSIHKWSGGSFLFKQLLLKQSSEGV